MKLFKKQLTKNILISGGSFLSSITIAILLVPYLVKHLGISAYGFIPLSMFLTEYISLITQSISSSITRFFTIKLNENKINDAQVIFNTALFGTIAISIILTLLFFYPLYNPDIIFNISDSIYSDVRILFICVFFNFLLSIISSVFNVSLLSKNRVDLLQLINIIRIISRVIFIAILFNTYEVSLASVGYASILSGLIVLVISIYYYNLYLTNISISLSLFDRVLASKLVRFSSWVLISQLGFILFTKIDLVLINIFLGDEKLGEYSVISQLSGQLRNAFGVLAGVLGPFILLKYTILKRKEFSSLLISLYSICQYIVFIPVMIIFVFSEDILYFWLGSNFIFLADTLKLLILGVGFMISPTPLYAYINAVGEVKAAAIISLGTGLMNIILALIFINYTALGYNGIAIAALFSIVIRDIIIIPLFSFSIIKEHWVKLIILEIRVILYIILFYTFLYLIKFNIEIESIKKLALVLLSCSLALLFFVFLISRHIEIKTIMKYA
ncbi:oligosaccharide flippase family protein [Morganella morganii]|uniref:oligosaccharide flippase family protein n=1 Tax=Morganella morganii TaxID=582 RepID=UPI00298E6583|nr:oligosaccharide flippase family protein [Morganella morganii]MDW7784446.1 oligosaccharide flippase family protein [Morganella morganii]MDW7791659.1 oligosaccharide flippase family protein [Morganella morganii]